MKSEIILPKADEGNPIALKKNDYISEAEKYTKLNLVPTKKFQDEIKNAIQSVDLILENRDKSNLIHNHNYSLL